MATSSSTTSTSPGRRRAPLPWRCFLDSRGNFWIGYDGGGLRCLPAGGGETRAWRVADGLAGNSVHDILEDGSGNIWVSTERGLSRLARRPRAAGEVRDRELRRRDGLQGEEFRYGTAFRSQTGEMFFGGQKGLNRFFPSRIKLNTQPPVLLTGLRLFNKPVVVGAKDSPLDEGASPRRARSRSPTSSRS